MGAFNVLCSFAEKNLGVVVLPSPQGKIEWSNFVLGRLRLVRTPHLNTALQCIALLEVKRFSVCCPTINSIN